MRMHLVAAIIAATLATPAHAAYREVDRWPMNEITGSGTLRGVNGHNGTYSSVISYPEGYCFQATCFAFGGVDSWARVADFADLDYANAAKQYGIIIHWNRAGAAPRGSSDRLIVRGNPNTGIGWAIDQRTATDGKVRICFSVRGSAGSLLGLCSPNVQAGSFRDIQAWIVPQTSTIEIWIDNRKVKSAVKNVGTVVTNLPLTICRAHGSATGWCHGLMDEVQILKEL